MEGAPLVEPLAPLVEGAGAPLVELLEPPLDELLAPPLDEDEEDPPDGPGSSIAPPHAALAPVRSVRTVAQAIGAAVERLLEERRSMAGRLHAARHRSALENARDHALVVRHDVPSTAFGSALQRSVESLG